MSAKITYVTEAGLLPALRLHGFDFPLLHRSRITKPDGASALIADFRALSSDYKCSWAGSVEDKNGAETHRFLVRR